MRTIKYRLLLKMQVLKSIKIFQYWLHKQSTFKRLADIQCNLLVQYSTYFVDTLRVHQVIFSEKTSKSIKVLKYYLYEKGFPQNLHSIITMTMNGIFRKFHEMISLKYANASSECIKGAKFHLIYICMLLVQSQLNTFSGKFKQMPKQDNEGFAVLII